MKFLLLGLIFIQAAYAGFGKIEEEVYIEKPTESFIELISQNPELTIDHMDQLGMELYGPRGMKEWLRTIDVSFKQITTHAQGHQHKSRELEADYPSFAQVEAYMRAQVAKNPSIAKMFSIGKSVEGRDLWVVKISDNVEVDEVEPEFKYISSMHGNEITGRELTQYFIRDLIEGYGSDSAITKMINNTEIYIMPSMNPDGSRVKKRANANNYDLNRNFPDWRRGDANNTRNRQPETVAVMDFQAKRNFSLSANLHGGAVVVNYPWDNTYDLHPFDKLIKDLSLRYADENPAMRNSRRFSRGITNGAQWYVLKGGMQDWSYYFYNDLQVTLEVSGLHWPRYSDIPGFYKDNKQSMMVYMQAVHQGAGIKFINKSTKGSVKILRKLVSGQTRDLGTYGFERGEFYKILEEGDYEFIVKKVGSSGMKSYDLRVSGEIKNNGNYVLAN